MTAVRRLVRRSSVTARLGLLLVLLTGVLGMHGFADVGGQTHAVAHSTDTVHGAGPDASGAAADVAAAGSAGGRDHGHPRQLHDALMGCMLALVGVAAVLLSASHRDLGTASRAARAVRSLLPVSPALLPSGPPLRLSLCVLRV